MDLGTLFCVAQSKNQPGSNIALRLPCRASERATSFQGESRRSETATSGDPATRASSERTQVHGDLLPPANLLFRLHRLYMVFFYLKYSPLIALLCVLNSNVEIASPCLNPIAPKKKYICVF